VPIGVVLVIVYVIAVLSPLLLVTALGLHSPNDTAYEVARSFALVAFAILALQPLLAARLKWIERPFGMDMVSRFHKAMGVFAAVLVLSHPPLMVLGGGGLSLVTSLDQPWYVLLGKGALALLLIHTALSLYWRRLGLTFERWRTAHYVAAPLIILVAFVHGLETGDDLKETPVRVLWGILLLVSLGAYVYHKAVKPALLARHPYRVTEVRQETHNVWTVNLAPTAGQPIPDYYPGQFQFITLQRWRNLPIEEHHWTISSSPTEKGFISSTIKESGDFTATIGKTLPGDQAMIHGPFGRFSHLLHPEDRKMVFIAGGIGITPFRAMLKHMSDTKADVEVVLLYGNQSEKDIVFREELAEISSGEKPRVKVVHVLSHPAPTWKAERGYIDRDKIERFAGPVSDKAFYVCGPPAMSAQVIDTLRELGVPYERIRTEVFSL
jgi:predicted ferric reductase